MHVEERVLLLPFTTFKMGGEARFFADLTSVEDIHNFSEFAESKRLPLIILGGGSNIIFNDEGVIEAAVGHMQIMGFEIVSKTDQEVHLRIGAGEEWDSVVERSVEMGLQGVEALSAIPGSTGATPVQNVGAYGQEVGDVLVSLEAYDKEEKKVITLNKEACKFTYRDSIFKHEGKDRYIIVSITLTLSKKPPQIPEYPGVKAYFKEKGVQNPTLRQIRDAILEIRKLKLPDPKLVASCGSFFKNPIVPKSVAEKIKATHPDAVVFEVSEDKSKIGAGWMIDALGLKGREFGNLRIYSHNALVVVNKSGASKKELLELIHYLQQEVMSAFGVTLEPEPVFVL